MPSETADDHLAKCLKLLGHPARIALLRLLASPERFPGNMVDPRAIGICVNDLARAAGLPQSTTSHHLGLLQAAGLLEATEHGPWRYIRANKQAFEALATSLGSLVP